MRNRVLCICVLLASVTASRVDAQCNNDFILISTTDLSSSWLSVLDPVTKTPTNHIEQNVGWVLRTFGGRVFGLESGDGTQYVEGMDPCSNFDHNLSPASAGAGAEPRDIYMVSSTIGYLTCYERNTLRRINLSGGFLSVTISVAAWADADNLPELDQMFVSGGRLYVCAQRLTHSTLAPTGTSMLGVFDLGTETPVDMDPGTAGVQGIPLIRQRPEGEINYRTRAGYPRAYFPCIGVRGVLDGGVIDCNLSNPSEQSLILSEVNAGGEIYDVEIVSDTKGFALIVTSTSFELIAFDPSTGLKTGPTMLSRPGDLWALPDCEPSSLGLLVSEFSLLGNPDGIRCFNMTTNAEIPGGPIDLGLSPYDILVRKGASVTGVDDMPVATGLGQNYPNPFNPTTTIPFTLASAGRVTLRIYDVRGALVATLIDERRDAGAHVARWDGHTNAGAIAPTGVYFARLGYAGRTETRKIALLK
jgi:hypothetical protein